MHKKPQVLIIGAGMAGLGAAEKLVAAEVDVTILEARDRVGGRTVTEPIAAKIFFAGEATHRSFPGMAHGAYLSGVREADRLLQLIS